MNDVLRDLNEILRKVIQIENEVEELKIMVMQMIADNLPEEEIDE